VAARAGGLHSGGDIAWLMFPWVGPLKGVSRRVTIAASWRPGSFTEEARYEAERASVPTTLAHLQSLRSLLVDSYEKVDAEARALVPL
jgi:hypothetical protein